MQNIEIQKKLRVMIDCYDYSSKSTLDILYIQFFVSVLY